MEKKITTKSSKILVIGDLHLKENLSYSEYVADQRIPEKKEILNFITEASKDCDNVVILGDCFDTKNPPAGVTRDFVSFIESFGDKEIYIISGNHSKKGDGTTALDFLKEIKSKRNWHVMTTPTQVEIEGIKIDFVPYMSKSELGVKTNPEAVEAILRNLKGGTYLFAHHCISDTISNEYLKSVNYFNEPILPKKKLEEMYKLVIAGHIHLPQEKGRTLLSGSIFTHDVGEKEKFVWKIGMDTSEVEKIKLPVRQIHKVEDPTIEQLSKIPDNSIVKVIITKKGTDLEMIRVCLYRFAAYILLEQYPHERTKLHFDGGAIDFTIPKLLEIYSQEKKIDLKILQEGYNMIQ